MPVYNGEMYIADSIQSVLKQTFGDFELIISDNTSQDGTEEICRSFAAGDARIRYVRNDQNIGAAANYNQLFELARGRYFRWSNADDLIAPELHEMCVGVLDDNPEAVLAYGKTEIIDGTGKKLRPYDDNLHLPQASANERFRKFFDQVGLTNVIYGLMRTSAVGRTKVFGDGTLPAADIGFMAEMTLHGTFLEIPRVLFYRRMHEEASSADRQDDERQQYFWRAESTPFRLPALRQAMRYVRAVWASGNAVPEKARLSAFLLRQLVWQRSDIAAEFMTLLPRRR